MYKIKNNDDFIIFSIYPDFSFHNLSNAQLMLLTHNPLDKASKLDQNYCGEKG